MVVVVEVVVVEKGADVSMSIICIYTCSRLIGRVILSFVLIVYTSVFS